MLDLMDATREDQLLERENAVPEQRYVLLNLDLFAAGERQDGIGRSLDKEDAIRVDGDDIAVHARYFDHVPPAYLDPVVKSCTNRRVPYLKTHWKHSLARSLEKAQRSRGTSRAEGEGRMPLVRDRGHDLRLRGRREVRDLFGRWCCGATCTWLRPERFAR